MIRAVPNLTFTSTYSKAVPKYHFIFDIDRFSISATAAHVRRSSG